MHNDPVLRRISIIKRELPAIVKGSISELNFGLLIAIVESEQLLISYQVYSNANDYQAILCQKD